MAGITGITGTARGSRRGRQATRPSSGNPPNGRDVHQDGRPRNYAVSAMTPVLYTVPAHAFDTVADTVGEPASAV